MKTSGTQHGFSVIEMLVAIVVFAILVPSVIGFLNTIGDINDRAKDVSLINSVVENKIESLRSAGFRTVEVGTTDFSSELPPGISSPRAAEYTVTELSPSVKKIAVSVTYTSRGGAKAVEYVTYIGEIGVGQY